MAQKRVVVAAVERFTVEKMVKITLDATANLIEDTPKKTGWARANWIPSIARPAPPVTGSQTRDDAGRFAGRAAGSVGQAQAAQQSGMTEVAGYRSLEQGKLMVTNNTAYIQRLNDGSSTQAPSGFVQSAILRALQANEG